MKFNLESYIELYITNECNLTCSNCNRFNNYDFRGHHSWTDNSQSILAWSQRITAPMITIIGGEPSVHPDLESWARGAATAWPDIPVVIQTNGLICIQDFVWWKRACQDHPNLGLGIAVHSPKFLPSFKRKWKGAHRGQFAAWQFSQCALQEQGAEFTVHDSNAELAWRACTMRYSHTMLHGRLYRCPVVAVLPEFQQQYRVKMTPDQQTLLDSYQSLAPDCSDQDLEQFVRDRDTCMPQCKLCPEQYVESTVTFDPGRKQWPPRRIA